MLEEALVDYDVLRRARSLQALHTFLQRNPTIFEENRTSAIYEELNGSLQTVFSDVVPIGAYRGGRIRQTAQGGIFSELENCYQSASDTVQSKTPIIRIVAFKLAFPWVRDGAVASFTDVSLGLVNAISLEVSDDGLTVIEGEPPSGRVREAVLARDTECRRCGKRDGLIAHHIVPRAAGGEDRLSNLAALCQPCHADAHGGVANTSQVVYRGKEGFHSDFLAEE